VGTSVTEKRHAKTRRTTQSIPSGTKHLDNHQDNPDLVTGDELTRDDWDDLKTIFQILKPFWHLTLQLQGTGTQRKHANGYLARVLPTIDDLLAHLEDSKQASSDSSIYSSHLLTSINHAWGILDRYVQIYSFLIYRMQVLFTHLTAAEVSLWAITLLIGLLGIIP